MTSDTTPVFSIRQVPFSRRGAYLSITADHWTTPLGRAPYLKAVHGKTGSVAEVFRLDLTRHGRAVASTDVARPGCLRLHGRNGGQVDFAFADANTVLIRGTGAGLRLKGVPGAGRIGHATPDGRWVLVGADGRHQYVVECRGRGRLIVDAPWIVTPDKRTRCDHVTLRLEPDASGHVEAAITEFGRPLPPMETRRFDACVAEAEADFAAWLCKTPIVSKGFEPGRRVAAYVNWSCMVEPRGHLTRPTMLMNKCHMHQVWCWDHCFNAMALVYHDPAAAWDQLMLMADHQDGHGAMPDSISDVLIRWNFGKPPVHGWALRFMMRRAPRFFTRERLRQAYDWLASWSGWWLEHRRWPGDALPYYIHGNDSGWDNSTLFDQGTPVVAPDLAAHLAVQLDVVSELAARLGKPRAAARWRKLSELILTALLEQLWKGDRFVGIRRPDGRMIDCESLITCIPLVLGTRLPADVRQALTARIARFVTPHGLATEAPDSPEYYHNNHAYWRGPVWPPPVMLIVDGLAQSGEAALAARIARRYCRAAARCCFRENFDALTGAGCSDYAYTWTSSVYLILAHEHIAGA